MALEDLMKEVSAELERLVSTKTVVGEAMVVGDTTIIPVTKVSFGFGSGGGEGKKKGEEEGFGGGGGAGAKIEPVAFIVISPEGTRLMSVSASGRFRKITGIGSGTDREDQVNEEIKERQQLSG